VVAGLGIVALIIVLIQKFEFIQIQMTRNEIAQRLAEKLLPLVNYNTHWLKENAKGYVSSDHVIVTNWITYFDGSASIDLSEETLAELLQDFNNLYNALSK
jgi:hypothetical protein